MDSPARRSDQGRQPLAWYWQPRFLLPIALGGALFSIVFWALVFVGAAAWPTTVPATNEHLDGQSLGAVASVVGAGVSCATTWITLRPMRRLVVRLLRSLGLGAAAMVLVGLALALAR